MGQSCIHFRAPEPHHAFDQPLVEKYMSACEYNGWRLDERLTLCINFTLQMSGCEDNHCLITVVSSAPECTLCKWSLRKLAFEKDRWKK